MWSFSRSFQFTRLSLGYITVGALVIAWTGIWFYYLLNHPTDNAVIYYLATGTLVSGLTLVLIGLCAGLSVPSSPIVPTPVATTTPATTPVGTNPQAVPMTTPVGQFIAVPVATPAMNGSTTPTANASR